MALNNITTHSHSAAQRRGGVRRATQGNVAHSKAAQGRAANTAQAAPTRPIYLDNAASTPMDERVIAAMMACLGATGTFGNSASKDHVYGWEAAEVIEAARDEVAQAVGCSPLELIFTSGATESNNLAIRGLCLGLKEQALAQGLTPKTHIITTTVEHKAVLECCEALSHEGFSVTYLKPRRDGTVTMQMLAEALTPNTCLVSISQANSVLGSLNNIDDLAQIARAAGAYYHSDCAQSNGLLYLELSDSAVSMVTLTPEKIYGPKGIGALYLKRSDNLPLKPLIVGGGHEKGLRGGTLATHQIAAMGKAFALMTQERPEVQAHLITLKAQLIAGLKTIPGAQLNGYLDPEDLSSTPHLPGIVSVSFDGINGQDLLPSLRKIACSSGSACSSKELKPSYVLTEIGLDDNLARASLRLSIGRFNTPQDIEAALDAIGQVVATLKA